MKEVFVDLKQVFPDIPPACDQALMSAAFSVTKKPPIRVICPAKRVVMLAAALLTILLCSIAFAAAQWGILDTLSFLFGGKSPSSNAQMQKILHQETINNVEITINETMYDGRTLFIQYSYRMLDEKEPLGILDANGNLMDGLTLEALEKLDEHHVGWWLDSIWINGQCIDMAEASITVSTGTLVPGEIVVTKSWRLDKLNIRLSGEVSITLPIGESQFASEHNSGAQPEKGVITFTFDAGNTQNQVTTLSYFAEPDMGIQVTEAAFSPLMTYITLHVAENPSALDEFISENGDGVYDSNGRLLWTFTNQDLYASFIRSLTLVDGSGNILFPNHSGCNCVGDNWAEFLYPYIAPEDMPNALWLAPVSLGAVNMSQAIRVK